MTRTSQINPVRAFPHLISGMTGFLIFIVIPLVFSFITSLLNWQPYGIPTLVGIKNHVDLSNGADSAFIRVLLNTAIFAVFYTTLSLVLPTLITVQLHSIGGKLVGLFRVIFFVPIVTSIVANALIWRLMFGENGVVNAFLSISGASPTLWLASEFQVMVVLVMVSLRQIIGYNIIVLGLGLNNTNPSVLEAVEVGGIGPFKRFFKAIFPLLLPALFLYTAMTLVGASKIFAQPCMLTKGGPGDSTTTIVLYLYNQGSSYDKLGYASVIAWVLFVIVMLTIALQLIGQKKWVNYDQ